MINLEKYGFSNYCLDNDLVLYQVKKDNTLTKVKYNKNKKGYQCYPDNLKQSRIIKHESLIQLFNGDNLLDPKKEWKRLYLDNEATTIYFISNYGDIIKEPTLTSPMKVVGLSKHNEGYLRFGYKNKYYYVHRLVAEHFIGKIPEDYVVNHIDGVKNNCYYKNLEIIPFEENVSHAWSSGLQNRNPYQKINNSYRLIGETDLKEINFKRRFKVYTIKALAEEYNCSIPYMQTIISRLKESDNVDDKDWVKSLMNKELNN